MALGLMTWLAWECGLDCGVARAENGRAGVEEDQWSWLQCLAYLVPQCAADEQALKLALDSVRETPRRGLDGDAWFGRHRSFMSEFASVVSDPEACTRVARAPRPGDIVFLAPQFEPRVRLVVDAQAGGKGDVITVVDEATEAGKRKFLAALVERLSLPARQASVEAV